MKRFSVNGFTHANGGSQISWFHEYGITQFFARFENKRVGRDGGFPPRGRGSEA